MKKIFSLFIAILISYTVKSQALGYLDLPVPGELWIEFKDTIGANFIVTPSAAGQVWNYQNSFTVHDTTEILFQNTSTVPSSISNLYPQSNMLEAGEITGDYTFYKTDFTGLYVDGNHSDVGIDVSGFTLNDVNNSVDLLLIPIPFQFGDVVQNTSSYEYVYPDPTLLPGALVRVTYTNFQDMETESQGELTTPLGTYSTVIRIKEMSTKTILYEIDSFAIGNYTYLTDLTFPTTSTYRWYKDGPNCLVMTATLDEFDNVTSASYFTSSGLVANHKADQFSFQVQPNPVNKGNKIYLRNNNQTANTYVIYDVCGRVIDQQPIISSSPIILTTDGFEAGTYFIKIFNQNEVLGVSKFIVTQ